MWVQITLHQSAVQQSSQPVKVQNAQFFLISEVQRNFHNELFDAVEAQ